MIVANREDEKMAANEISLLNQLGNHDRIVHLMAAFVEANIRHAGKLWKRVMLVFESCCMTVRDFMLSQGQVSEGWRNLIVQQVVEGLQRLQVAYVMHRDLKAANMLMAPCSSTPGMLQVKLADFGTAILVQKPDDGKDPQQHLCRQAKRNYTTYTVAPPEILQEWLYTFGTDSWAVGVLYLELCIGKQWLKLPQQERERDVKPRLREAGTFVQSMPCMTCHNCC